MYKAIIVDDDPMVADIDRQYLQAHAGITIVGAFGNGRVALEYVREYPTDLAIVDYYLLETGEITSEIDYATGGRPSMRY